MDRIYYTYAYLREDRTPYYIGKGKGRRAYKRHNVKVPPKDRILFLKKNLTEEEALRHEVYMIAVFGRKNNNTGILRNLTDGGEGPSGYVFTPDDRNKVAEAIAGMVWWNNGETQTRAVQSPGVGWVSGMLTGGGTSGYSWWNNGEDQVLAPECPGDGWVPGNVKGKCGPTSYSWWNDGTTNKMTQECPGPEWKPGRLLSGSWWNNGETQKLSEECPGEGWVQGGINRGSTKGTRWWNNGREQKRTKECPGEGWILGRLKKP